MGSDRGFLAAVVAFSKEKKESDLAMGENRDFLFSLSLLFFSISPHFSFFSSLSPQDLFYAKDKIAASLFRCVKEFDLDNTTPLTFSRTVIYGRPNRLIAAFQISQHMQKRKVQESLFL